MIAASKGRELPPFVRDLISSPPQRGGGLNSWLFRVARVLHPFREHDEILVILEAATAGLALKHGEIERAVKNSKAVAWNAESHTPTTRAKPWPAVSPELRQSIIASGSGLSDLWETSPYKWGDEDPHTEEILDILFPGNPLLCIGKSSWEFATRPREEYRGQLSRAALIVPAFMTAQTGLTKDGKESEHTLSNTGERRFLVVEQDEGTPDEQAAILLHLAERWPLVLAVSSGGKSIHGWFYCQGMNDHQLRPQMAYAVSLGADPATWTRSQFVRIPDGTRENGAKQRVYFFNSGVITP